MQCTEAANLAFLAIDNAASIVCLALSESAILCEYCANIVRLALSETASQQTPNKELTDAGRIGLRV